MQLKRFVMLSVSLCISSALQLKGSLSLKLMRPHRILCNTAPPGGPLLEVHSQENSSSQNGNWLFPDTPFVGFVGRKQIVMLSTSLQSCGFQLRQQKEPDQANLSLHVSK